jgi:hypothetical protein
MMGKTRTSIPLRDKVLILQELDKKIDRKLIEGKFKVKKWDISKIKKNKDTIMEEFGKQLNKRIRLKSGNFPEVEDTVKNWMTEMTGKGVNITRLEIRIKALAVAQSLGLQAFNASEGWITNVCKRQGVGITVFHGDVSSVSEITVHEWKGKRSSLTTAYDMKDVFNLDELGLFFKLLPSRSYTVSGKPFRSGKRGEERVTLLLGCNAAGTEKLPPLMISKSQKPRCFKKSEKKIIK